MESNLSSFETRMMVKWMGSKTDAGIAELLNRTEAEIHEAIRTITGGRSAGQKAYDKKKKAAQQKALAKRVAPKEKAFKPRADEDRRKRQKALLQKPAYVTRQVDLSQLVSVRVDAKTCIYIKPGQDAEAEKEKYLARLQDAKSRMMAAVNPSKEVKKFKPV